MDFGKGFDNKGGDPVNQILRDQKLSQINRNLEIIKNQQMADRLDRSLRAFTRTGGGQWVRPVSLSGMIFTALSLLAIEAVFLSIAGVFLIFSFKDTYFLLLEIVPISFFVYFALIANKLLGPKKKNTGQNNLSAVPSKEPDVKSVMHSTVVAKPSVEVQTPRDPIVHSSQPVRRKENRLSSNSEQIRESGTRSNPDPIQDDKQIRVLRSLLKDETEPSERDLLSGLISDRLYALKTGSPGPRKTGADLDMQIGRAFSGLVGFDTFKKALVYDLKAFVGTADGPGVCRMFWGESVTGKTEVAQRFAGLRHGYPAVCPGYGRSHYVSCVERGIDVRQITDDLPGGSIVFVDDADRHLDEACGVVSAVEARQFHTAILTNLGRKRLYWVFLGSFIARRGGRPMTSDMIDAMLGRELAGRMDFMDWKFPEWNIENLLLASRLVVTRLGMTFEDEAVLLLANECLEKGSGVRGLENLLEQIKRRMVLDGDKGMHIDRGAVAEHLNKLKVGVAA